MRCWDNLFGLGTGKLRESYDAIVAGGALLPVGYVQQSARMSEADLQGSRRVRHANVLVRLSLEHDVCSLTKMPGKPCTPNGSAI